MGIVFLILIPEHAWSDIEYLYVQCMPNFLLIALVVFEGGQTDRHGSNDLEGLECHGLGYLYRPVTYRRA